MTFKEVFTAGAFCLDLKSDHKAAIIAEMVDAMQAQGLIQDRDEIINAVMEREEKGSTGMQHGVAVPHGKADSVKELVAAFGIKRDGVDFDSLDGQPCRIFILTVSSTLLAGPHMSYLAEISRVISKPDVREKLLASTARDEIIKIICGG